ncbi:hypothetical protein [Promicromonospora iranensis]|uniref:Uncharacterized protein n=1 Tax=Promicromonospora iranensis TaxID=1105144 RepID=A0ABU2CGV2_9MICO|nr:hypothetical protein [Promicromonospora iranensis]MDR7380568.1 hypothetical protein [Promicromonospora iranensis]
MIPSPLTPLVRRITLHLADPARRPLPTITVHTRPTLRGWTFRAALLALVPLLLFTAAARTPGIPHSVTLTIAALATGLVVVHPTPTTAGGVIAVAAVLFWGFTSEPFDPWALAVALLAHLLARTTWWAAHVPPQGHAEIAALLTSWRRDLTVLAATALLGALAMLASGTTVQGAVLLAALAVVGLVLVALATDGSSRDDGRS